MKKVRKNLVFVICVLSLISCSNSFNSNKCETSNNTTFENTSYSSEASKVIGNLFELQIKTCEKAVNTVSLYTDEQNSSRSIFNELDFNDIGKYLPSDLSLLKRTVSKDSRSVAGETITLEEELNEIVNEYEDSLKEIMPDYSKASIVEGVNISESGYIFGNDAEIPFCSIQGIITTAILNEVADGKNIEDILSTIEEDMSSLNFESSERAITLKSTAYWPNGTINYRWGSITEEHKELMQNAMKIWSDETDNAINFCELDDNGWMNFTLAIHVRGCVIFNTKKLNSGVAGNSMVGCIGGKQELNISETLGKNQYVRTPVHELGHVLGLQHEHMRYNRDNYIEISEEDANDTVNYGKIPLSISGWRWESRTVKIGWWRVTLWYPIFWENEYSWQSDNFDFESVMLYPNLKVKEDKITQNNGNSYTVLYSTPSKKDIEMIKRMY